MSIVYAGAAGVSLSRDALLASATNATIMAWLFPTSAPASGQYANAFALENTLESSGVGVSLFNNAGTTKWDLGTTTSDSVGTTVSLNTWKHLTLTKSAAATQTLYLDGVSDATNGTSEAAGTRVVIGNFVIATGGGAQFSWIGRIAYVKIWDAVLTAAEILQEMRQGLPVRTANLKAFYPMFSTNDRTDYSGQAQTLTATGTAPTSAEGPPIPWRQNRSRIFYVPSAGGGGPTTLTPSAAVSTWIVPTATLSVGPVTLAPSAASSTWVVPAATLAVGPLTLSPAAATSSWTVPAPSLSVGGVTLSPSAAASTWTVPSATLSKGPVTLSPSAALSTWNVPSASLSVGPVTLAPSAASSTWTVPAASFSAGTILTPSPAVSTWVLPSASLAVGPLTLPATPAVRTWNVPAAALSPGALSLLASSAVTAWVVPAAAFGELTPVIHLDEPLSIDFTSLATAIDFTSLATAIDFGSLETMLVFLDGGRTVFELTILKGEVATVTAVLQGADPNTNALVPYDVSAATLELNAGKTGVLVIDGKTLTKPHGGADGVVACTFDASETAVPGRYDALAVATFPGSPQIIRKFPGRIVIKDAIA